MLQLLKTQAFNRVVGLTMLTLMVIALVASPSAVSRSQDISPPAVEAGLLDRSSGDQEIRHEGE